MQRVHARDAILGKMTLVNRETLLEDERVSIHASRLVQAGGRDLELEKLGGQCSSWAR